MSKDSDSESESEALVNVAAETTKPTNKLDIF